MYVCMYVLYVCTYSMYVCVSEVVVSVKILECDHEQASGKRVCMGKSMRVRLSNPFK
jgi:hypothetical protein